MDVRNVSSTAVSRPMASSLPEETAAAVTAPAVTTDESSSQDASTGKTATATAGYISPYLRYDQGARVAVLLFRDVDTGETQDQIPSRRVVEEYRRAAGRLPQDADETASAGAAQPTRPGGGAVMGLGAAATSANGNGAGRGISFASAGTPSPVAPSLGFSTGSAPAATAAPPPSVSAGNAGEGAPGGRVSVTV